MIQSVNFYTFHDTFKAIRPDNFNYSGLRALFEYLEQYEDDIGESIELDVIALCGEYSQYDSAEEAMKDYSLEDGEDLSEHTTVIECDDGSIIIQDF
tara:strand:+ start:1009 stop:1299 length:291 start_codon:yes stop_codon:yes gene_type:complete